MKSIRINMDFCEFIIHSSDPDRRFDYCDIPPCKTVPSVSEKKMENKNCLAPHDPIGQNVSHTKHRFDRLTIIFMLFISSKRAAVRPCITSLSDENGLRYLNNENSKLEFNLIF